MDENLETISTEIVETAAPVPAPEKPQEPKKGKGLVATTILMTILAIAGIAFGVYGMFFDKKTDCETNCTGDSFAQIDQDSTETYTAPTADEVAALLDSKYSLKAQNTVMYQGMYSYIDNLDYTNKLSFTILATKDQQNEKPVSYDESYSEIRTIGYDDLNSQFKKYFGNQQDIEKKNYTFDKMIVQKMDYDANNDLFTIQYPAGLGGASFIERYIKVNKVVGTKDGFYALVTAATIDAMIRREIDGITCMHTSSDGTKEYYDIEIPEEELDKIYDSLSLYKFNFITEDGEYKLISVEKF